MNANVVSVRDGTEHGEQSADIHGTAFSVYKHRSECDAGVESIPG